MSTSPRPPRLRVSANGAVLPGAISFRVTANNYFHAGTYEADLALFADSGHGPGWWGAQDSTLLLKLEASVDGGRAWKPLITGQLDAVYLNMSAGIARVSGRDLSARLIEAKTKESYQNQTASQIAEKLAAKRHLSADVQATSTPVGRYYSADHDEVRLNQFSRFNNEWDMLVYLAQHEQFSVWVTGTTLHFRPPPSGGSPFMVTWQANPFRSNVERLSVQRSLTLTKDAAVGVRSWNSRHARGFTKWAPHEPINADESIVQQYVYVFPNLTEQQAQQKAQSLWAEISKHERLVEFTAPGDLDLSPQSKVQVSGTGSSWDQDYYIDRIDRSISTRAGFTMSVRCKNHSPESSVAP